MRPRRTGVRRLPVLLLLAAVTVLGVGPAAGEEPLRLVDVAPSDQHVTAVVDVPGSQMPGTPSPQFEVLDGESRLVVEVEPVLQPRRSLTLVVDAAGAGSASSLEELKQAATDLLLRLGTTVEPALVISRAAAPAVLPSGGVAAAVAAVGDLRPGARRADALVPAVRAALTSSGDGTSGLRVVLVLAASGGDVPPTQLREELSGEQALVHVLAVGGTVQQYWREAVPEGVGELVADGSGPGTGSLVRRLAGQHVVSFRKPRSDGSVVLRLRTADGVLASTIDLGPAPGLAVEQGSGAKRVVVVGIAVLALSVVSVGLLAVAAGGRRRGLPRRSLPLGVAPAGRRLRPASAQGGQPGTGRHYRNAHPAPPEGGERRGSSGGPWAAPARGHAAPSRSRSSAAPATGPHGAAAPDERAIPARGAGKHVRAWNGGPRVGGGELPPGSGSAADAETDPDPETARDRPGPPTVMSTAGTSAGAASSSDVTWPSPSRWGVPLAVPRQRRSAPASDTGRSTPPDAAPPPEGGPHHG